MLNVGGARGRDWDSTQGDGVRTPSKATMLLIAGEGLLTTHTLTERRGRHRPRLPTAIIVVPSPHACRADTRCLRLGPPLTLQDLDSRNGTRLAGAVHRGGAPVPLCRRRRLSRRQPLLHHHGAPSAAVSSMRSERRRMRCAARPTDAGARVDAPGEDRAQRRQRAHPRRDRRRQGGARRDAAPRCRGARRARWSRINCAALSPSAARERAVRPREGRVHRRHAAKPGLLEAADGRHRAPRRGRRAAARAAGQAAARDRERGGHCASARVAPRRSTCASSRRPTATSRPRSARGAVPRRPLLPPRRRRRW